MTDQPTAKESIAKEPTMKQWQALYEAWDKVKAQRPWEWMTETDLFGVQDPDTDQLSFVSVMGMLGEHYAVSVYLGSQALYEFLELEETGPYAIAQRLLEIPQLQASFEDRDQLHARDREIIKALGRKYRGRQAWPLFRSFQPGYAPWFMTADDVRLLTLALQQLPDIARRFREDQELLDPETDDQFLVRVARSEQDQQVWEDQIMTITLPEPMPIQIGMDPEALAELAQQPTSMVTLEVDLFIMLSPVRSEEGRPVYPYVLMLAETRNGAILGSQLLTPEPTLRDMWSVVPVMLVYQLATIRLVPKQINVRSPLLLQLLQPLTAELPFKLKQVDALPNVDMAREMLFQHLF